MLHVHSSGLSPSRILASVTQSGHSKVSWQGHELYYRHVGVISVHTSQEVSSMHTFWKGALFSP